MKKSELKQIIRECIEELEIDEGPAREHRKKTGIQYQTAQRDPLKARLSNSKRDVDGIGGSGRLAKKPLKTMVRRDKEASDSRKKHFGGDQTIVHFKRASGGSKESARKRQWDIDHNQDVNAKTTKRGKLPKDRS